MKNGKMLINEELFPEGKIIFYVLFDHYFDNKNANEPYIDDANKEFCHSLIEIDPFLTAKTMSTATVLCIEHEQAGFEAEIKTRIQIERELAKLPLGAELILRSLLFCSYLWHIGNRYVLLPICYSTF